LISGSLNTLTGGYIYDRQLVDYLRQKGHHVEVIELPFRNYLDRLLHSPIASFRELKSSPVDILLEDELDHPALIYFNRKLRRQAIYPVVSIVHNLHCSEFRASWQNRLYRQIEKYYLMSVDGFIFNSLATQQAVEKLIETHKPAVIANPCGDRLPVQISEKEIAERAMMSGPLRILFLGNLFRNKSLHVLLAALADLPRSKYYLTVVGDLTMDKLYVKEIREQIRKHNLNKDVSLTGPLNNGELTARLKENQVLAVPSFYEGYGIAYLEGMGCGLPAIGTTSGGATEIINHGINGFLIPPGDRRALSRYLNELNQDRERLKSMSLKALQLFKTHPTWQATCEKILAFLLSLRNAH
jgi:glycosyltransferase involved in cell wall biosynthesis